MKNTSAMAEMFMIIDQGFADGGEPTITKYYKKRKVEDEEFFIPIRDHVDDVIQEIIDNTAEELIDSTFYDAPNFLVLFAALAFVKGLSPLTKISEGFQNHPRQGADWVKALPVLIDIAKAVVEYDPDLDADSKYAGFVAATKSTTHRVSSRSPRFEVLVNALA
jgi:hypothetical protein